jgi:hypothetical protein
LQKGVLRMVLPGKISQHASLGVSTRFVFSPQSCNARHVG